MMTGCLPFKSSSDVLSAKFKCKKFQGSSGYFNIKVAIVIAKTLYKIRDKQYYPLSINHVLIGYFRYDHDQIYYVDSPWDNSKSLDSMPEQVIYIFNKKPENQAIIQSSSEWFHGSKLAITKLDTHTTENSYRLNFTSVASRSSDYKYVQSLTFSEKQGIQDFSICMSHGGCKECIK